MNKLRSVLEVNLFQSNFSMQYALQHVIMQISYQRFFLLFTDESDLCFNVTQVRG